MYFIFSGDNILRVFYETSPSKSVSDYSVDFLGVCFHASNNFKHDSFISNSVDLF